MAKTRLTLHCWKNPTIKNCGGVSLGSRERVGGDPSCEFLLFEVRVASFVKFSTSIRNMCLDINKLVSWIEIKDEKMEVTLQGIISALKSIA